MGVYKFTLLHIWYCDSVDIVNLNSTTPSSGKKYLTSDIISQCNTRVLRHVHVLHFVDVMLYSDAHIIKYSYCKACINPLSTQLDILDSPALRVNNGPLSPFVNVK